MEATMLPNITISTADFDRLEALADSLPANQSTTKAALLGELARADVVEPGELPPTVVRMNCAVRFLIESTGEEFQRTLTFPHDAARSESAISVLSPVGTALLGVSVNDRIAWNIPGRGSVQVKILEIIPA